MTIMSFNKVSSFLMLCTALLMWDFVRTTVNAQDSDKWRQATSIIEDAADRLCQNPDLNHAKQTSTLSGDAKAALGGAAAKIVDLGISGSASRQTEYSTGIMENDIVAALTVTNDCKKDVLHTMWVDMMRFFINVGGEPVGTGDQPTESVTSSSPNAVQMPNQPSKQPDTVHDENDHR